MLASGLLWAARDPVATMLAYVDHAWAIRQLTRLSHAYQHQATEDSTMEEKRKRGEIVDEEEAECTRNNPEPLRCTPFSWVTTWAIWRDRLGSRTCISSFSRRGEFFAYFCGWRERVNIFRKESQCLFIPLEGRKRLEIYAT